MSTIIGLGILAILFIYIALNLEEQHQILKVVSLIFGLLIMLSISSYILNNQDHCEVVVTFTNETSPTANEQDIAYEYQRLCFTRPATGSGLSAFKLMNYFIRIAQWYAFIFVIYYILGLMGIDLLDKAQQIFKGK